MNQPIPFHKVTNQTKKSEKTMNNLTRYPKKQQHWLYFVLVDPEVLKEAFDFQREKSKMHSSFSKEKKNYVSLNVIICIRTISRNLHPSHYLFP